MNKIFLQHALTCPSAFLLAASLTALSCGTASNKAGTQDHRNKGASSDATQADGIAVSFGALSPSDSAAVVSPSPSTSPTPSVSVSPIVEPSISPSPIASVTPMPSPVVTTPVPSPVVTPSHDGDDNDDDCPGVSRDIDDDERGECAHILSVPTWAIHVANRDMTLNLQDADALAIKVSGNQRQLKVTLNGTKPLKGVCIFATGSQSTVALETNTDVHAVYYKGRGNQSSCGIKINANSRIDQLFTDLSGNQSKLHVWGDGEYKCPTATMHGHNPQITCDH